MSVCGTAGPVVGASLQSDLIDEATSGKHHRDRHKRHKRVQEHNDHKVAVHSLYLVGYKMKPARGSLTEHAKSPIFRRLSQTRDFALRELSAI